MTIDQLVKAYEMHAEGFTWKLIAYVMNLDADKLRKKVKAFEQNGIPQRYLLTA